jgi:uncharacterized SAM-binding protein YcdF (DUF218 family)
MDASSMGKGAFLDHWPAPVVLFAWALKLVARMFVVGGVLFLVGLVLFAHLIEDEQKSDVDSAEGIVVLTGGQERITQGLRLLSAGKAGRLFISGVNSGTSRRQLSALYPGNSNWFRCCVDLGWRARNTIGNADETRSWVARRGLRSIILVTSETHMPRSIMEMRRLMPDVVLTPYSVRTQQVQVKNWWWERHTLRIVLIEYIKFVPSLGRCIADRLVAADGALGVRGACLNFGFKY